MMYLSAVTLLWAFSFSLIGVYLSGHVDSYFSALMRVSLACLVFLPFLKVRGIRIKTIATIMAIGGIQLGLMYCFYFQSFLLLTVPEVLLFTVFTPIYVTLIYDVLNKRFSAWYLVTAIIAVLGAICIKQTRINENFLVGFFVVQGANLCFAIGQVWYKKLMETQSRALPQKTIFGYFYIGALIVSAIVFLALGHPDQLPTTTTQWSILVYLGVVASGLGYFGWNKGACQVNAGALAIMNNILIPAGLIVNIVIWNKDVDIPALLLGGSIIVASLWMNEHWVKKKTQ